MRNRQILAVLRMAADDAYDSDKHGGRDGLRRSAILNLLADKIERRTKMIYPKFGAA